MGKIERTAVLVALGGTRNQEETQEYLNELAFLAETSGMRTIFRFVQNLPHPDSRFFVGKGKIEEIAHYVSQNSVNNVIFDEDLSPSQLRNLEKALNSKDNDEKDKVRIYDRSLLILEIFWLARSVRETRIFQG